MKRRKKASKKKPLYFIHGKVYNGIFWFHSRIARVEGGWYVPPCVSFPKGAKILQWQGYPIGQVEIPFYTGKLKRKILQYLERIAPYKVKYAKEYLRFILRGNRGNPPKRPQHIRFMESEAIRARIQTILEV